MTTSTSEDERLGWEGWAVLILVFTQALPIGLYFVLFGIEASLGGGGLVRRTVGDEVAVSLETSRVIVGFGLALVFVALAAWLVRSTDWDQTPSA